jgi:predicted metal-dependent hydrolase
MEVEQIQVSGLNVEVARKPIKNLHLTVHPPDGQVRVSAPEHLSMEAVRAAVITRLGWIKRNRERLIQAPRQSPREMVSGESHYFDGRRYLLHIQTCPGPVRVHVSGNSRMVMQADARSTRDSRLSGLNDFYRQHLAEVLPALVDKWASTLGVPTPTWTIRAMRTRWGTANVDKARVTFNLELAKQSERSLDYVVLHELAHLLDRTHSAKFTSLMDTNMPDWRERQAALNASQALWTL